MGLLAGIGDFGLDAILQAALDAKVKAVLAANSAEESLISVLGPFKPQNTSWNVLTNTPNLSALGLVQSDQGKLWIVAVGGTSNLTGTSITYNIGDSVYWSGQNWVRRAFTISSKSIGTTELKDASVTPNKTTFFTYGKNLFNKYLVIEGSAVNNSGAIQSSQSTYSISGKCSVLPLTTYTLSGSIFSPAFVKVRFEDELGNFLGVYNANSANFTSLPATFSTPANCTNLIFNTKTASSGNYDNIQLELGSVATSYEPFKLNVSFPLLGLPLNSVTKDSILDRVVSAIKTDFIIAGKNKIDKSAIVENLVITDTGLINASNGYSIVKCEVKPLAQYIYSGVMNAQSGVRIRFEDSSGTFLGVYNAVSANFTTLPATFTTPANCTRLWISTKINSTSDYNTIQLELGATVTQYESFYLALDSIYTNALSSFSKYDIDYILSKFSVKGKNLIDKNKIIEGLTLNNSGSILSLANYSMILVNVLPNTAYTYSGVIGFPSGTKVRFEQSDGTFISVYNANGANFTTLPATFTTPANCTRLWISTKINSTSDYNTIQLELGSVATVYEAYKITMSSDNVDLSSVYTKAQSDLIYGKLTVPSKNLINKDLIQENKGLTNTTGLIVTQAGYAICPAVVEPSTQYVYSGTMVLPQYVKIRFEDASGAFLGLYNSNSADFSTLPAVFYTPANCVKIYITVKTVGTSDYNSIQLEKGAVPTTYIAFGNKIPSSQLDLVLYYTKAQSDATFANAASFYTKVQSDLLYAKYTIQGKNLFNKAAVIEGQAVSNTGAIVNDATYAITEKITVTPSTVYTLSGAIGGAPFIKIRYEQSDGTFISVYNANSANFTNLPATFTTPAGCTKVIINVKANSTSDYNTIQIELGSVATSYVSFGSKLDASNIDLSSYYTKNQTDAVFVKPNVPSKNLIDKSKIIEAQAVNNTGAIVNQSGYAITEKITVLPLTSYTLSGTVQNPQYVKIRYEDAGGALLGVYNANSANFSTLPATFTTPSLCVKVIINVKAAGTSNYDTVQLELGTVATGYTAGINKINPDYLDLSALNLSGYVSKASYLIWQGKKWAFLGDSITAQGYYIPYVQAVHGFTWEKDGIGGSCIAQGKEDIENDGVHRTAFVDRIAGITAMAADGIFIFGGTNDWYYNVPIGVVTDTVKTTFYGALKYLLATLQSQNVGKTIVICTPLQRGNSRANYTAQKAYADAIKEVSGMYSVPLLDLFNSSGITYENIGQFTSDNVHPSSAVGAPYIARKMNSFLFRV
ncbi:GDSL-type esterase/lipase family protein [Dyadobacter sp. 3J3]|uniref:SGNH/GDSL hydrolase family protein n=1 Tax=Dyadobacter sp. 3J3 TaxID=2606600 RepID=UPI0013570EAE|nr:GDSL-type esterase/lipase family protein [Dyadobacter sp. 3J3]